PGLTATEIHVAVIADTPDPIAGVNTWAAIVNGRKGGLGGRKVVVDAFTVNGDAAKYAAAVTTACTQDFAIVGSSSVADGATTDLVACAIPDLPARAFTAAHRGAAGTYAVVPTSPTKEQVGGFKFLLGAVQGCCKQYVVKSTDAGQAIATESSMQAAVTAGFTTAGSTALATDAPDSAYTGVATSMQTSGATFGRSDLPFDSTITLRTAGASLTGVKAWFCLAQCYSPTFLSQGGPAVASEYVQIGTNPFEEAAAIPALKTYLAHSGPQTEPAVESYAASLLFDQATRQVLAQVGKDGLTRALVLGKVAATNGFTAGNILGPTNVGGRVPTGCFVMMQVTNGKFTRVSPTTAKTLSCGDQNLVTVGP
ncbi:MAG: hypothetical protein WCI50_14250, partial [Actinomycetes bacterium]